MPNIEHTNRSVIQKLSLPKHRNNSKVPCIWYDILLFLL